MARVCGARLTTEEYGGRHQISRLLHGWRVGPFHKTGALGKNLVCLGKNMNLSFNTLSFEVPLRHVGGC